MKLSRAAALVPLACLAIAGCKISNPLAAKPPTGQVVATVYGHEITTRDLQVVLAGTSFPDGTSRKRGEEQALGQIITLKVQAEEARKEGIDKTPDFALRRELAMDALLAQSLKEKFISSVPLPSHEEAERFVLNNPDRFAQRKVFVIQQIIFPTPNDPSVVKAFGPLSTIEEVKAVLDAHHIPSRLQNGQYDSVTGDPTVVARLLNLKPTDLLLEPSGANMSVNHVTAINTVPLSGDPAVKVATELLRRQQVDRALTGESQRLGVEAKGHVLFNKAYLPAKGPAPAPAAPSAAANAGAGS